MRWKSFGICINSVWSALRIEVARGQQYFVKENNKVSEGWATLSEIDVLKIYKLMKTKKMNTENCQGVYHIKSTILLCFGDKFYFVLYNCIWWNWRNIDDIYLSQNLMITRHSSRSNCHFAQISTLEIQHLVTDATSNVIRLIKRLWFSKLLGLNFHASESMNITLFNQRKSFTVFIQSISQNGWNRVELEPLLTGKENGISLLFHNYWFVYHDDQID